MNNWNEAELAFRCERLSVRLEKLAQNFLEIVTLATGEATNSDRLLAIIKQSKSFLELAAIDLEVDSAFELAQIQRQLSRWHLHWSEVWSNEADRQAIATLARTWASQMQGMAGALV